MVIVLVEFVFKSLALTPPSVHERVQIDEQNQQLVGQMRMKLTHFIL